MAVPLDAPLLFTPKYQAVVWGGRRMARFRGDLPDGPIGESWDLADHDRGMSVVAAGPLAGRTLRSLCEEHGSELVGDGWKGGVFPLMVKLIDASDRLSVQVHPDDRLARALGVGDNGKTECWYMIGDGGDLFQGTRPGIDRSSFERALADRRIEDALNRFSCRAGDFFYLEARTVHALGAGCLLYEVQQTCDVTFRVWDWGRNGLDGKPRPLHIAQSLDTIDFSLTGFGPRRGPLVSHPHGGRVRALTDCGYFSIEERALEKGEFTRDDARVGDRRCSIISCLSGAGRIETAGGAIPCKAMQTVLVPAAAGGFRVGSSDGGVRMLHAVPKFAA